MKKDIRIKDTTRMLEKNKEGENGENRRTKYVGFQILASEDKKLRAKKNQVAIANMKGLQQKKYHQT